MTTELQRPRRVKESVFSSRAARGACGAHELGLEEGLDGNAGRLVGGAAQQAVRLNGVLAQLQRLMRWGACVRGVLGVLCVINLTIRD